MTEAPGSSLEIDVTVPRRDFDVRISATTGAGVTALFGPSGAGKTTVLDAIAGLLHPRMLRGRIALDGRPLFDSDKKVFVPPHRRQIGYVFQQDRLFPHLSVRENLEYGVARAAENAADIDSLVEILEIEELLERSPQRLSGGERRRVALGRALLTQPRLLLLDEPLTGVDHGRGGAILDYLKRIRDELSVPMLYVSHSLGEVLQLTRSFVFVDRGQVIGQGDYYELLGQQQAFALADRLGLVNVFELEISDTEAELGVTHGRLGKHRLRLPPWALPAGHRVTVGLRPQDIILATAAPTGLSLQNRVEGVIVALIEVSGKVLVRIDVGQDLAAEITVKARDELSLATGQRIHCLFKANALERLQPRVALQRR